MFRSDITALRQNKRYERQEIDVADGYIHLSSFDQAIKTAELYFKGQSSLVMAQLRVMDLEKFRDTDATKRPKNQPILTFDWVEARQAFMPHFHASHIHATLIKSFIELTPNESNDYEVPSYLDLNVPQSNFVYKIALADEWEQSISQVQRYCGNDKDRADGFIHLSNIDQLAWVAQKFNQSKPKPNEYVLLIIPTESIQSVRLVYDWSAKMRNDPSIDFPALFAHYYDLEGGIQASWVLYAKPISDLNNVLSLID